MPSISHASGARIVADRLSYALPDGRVLLNDLTLSFGRERTGLVGANGSGKTTLVRLLAGELTPSGGSVHRSASVAVLPQEYGPRPDLPLTTLLGVADRLEALRRSEAGAATVDDIERIGDDWDLASRVEAVLQRFGLGHLPLDRPLGEVSGGEATRVALAALGLGRPDFLLLDEPTNHLDLHSRRALYDFVEAWQGGLLCVSHDRALLRRMDRIVEISPVGLRIYGGNYDHYREMRDTLAAAAEREMESARAALHVAEREAREQRERQARREAQGKRDRVGANMPRILLNARRAQAQATGARVRATTGREVEERRSRLQEAREQVEDRVLPRFEIPPTGLPVGRVVLEMEGVTVGFPDSERPALAGVSLRIVGPERVALVGPNGSGKSTFLRVALGRLAASEGTVRRLPAAEVAFLDQEGASLDPACSVLDNFRLRHPGLPPTAARYALARFLFSDEAALQPVGTLSGGQRLRASLATILGGAHPPLLLVLDEPTNHLDLDAMEALESALRNYDGALLVVSHDEEFLERIGVERRLKLPGARPGSAARGNLTSGPDVSAGMTSLSRN